MTWNKIKPYLWSAAGGAVVISIIGFSLGGWVTAGTARRTAIEMAETAVVDRLAPICVAQFLQDPNREERLKELKKLDSWNRADYVKEQGWAIMPGEKESDYKVANECARLLVEFEK